MDKNKEVNFLHSRIHELICDADLSTLEVFGIIEIIKSDLMVIVRKDQEEIE